MYNDKIMEHFQNPRNVGEIENANGVGTAGRAETGDMMKMYLRIENGKVIEAKHKTFGSGVAIAVSSMASLMVIGKTVDEACAITREEVSEALDGIPPEKIDCSNMAPKAIHNAIDDYRARQKE